MNLTLTIVGDSASEMLDALGQLSAGLTPAIISGEPKPTKPEAQTVEPVTPTRTRTKAVPKEVPQEAGPVVKSEAIAIEDVRALVQSKATAGKRDEVKALLNSFNVARVTDLDESQYADFMKKAENL